MLPSVQEVKSCKMSPGFPSSKLASQLLKMVKIGLSGIIFFLVFWGEKKTEKTSNKSLHSFFSPETTAGTTCP